MLLQGKKILVTGSTSGIGRATAIAAAVEGASVMVTGRRREEADRTVSLIRDSGGEAYSVVGEITDSSFANDLVAATVASLGGLDGVVNAAGVIVRADAADTTDEQWGWQMAVNVDGVFFVSRAAVPALRAAGAGSIVNVSSTCGNVGAAGLAGYCATKGAVISLTQAMALEHAQEAIRVNAVCPGAIDTPMLASEQGPGVTAADAVRANLPSIPQGRVPGPEEVADLITFLLSDKSRHITGADLAIDGGYTAQ